MNMTVILGFSLFNFVGKEISGPLNLMAEFLPSYSGTTEPNGNTRINSSPADSIKKGKVN